jgi:hypothetical protein
MLRSPSLPSGSCAISAIPAPEKPERHRQIPLCDLPDISDKFGVDGCQRPTDRKKFARTGHSGNVAGMRGLPYARIHFLGTVVYLVPVHPRSREVLRDRGNLLEVSSPAVFNPTFVTVWARHYHVVAFISSLLVMIRTIVSSTIPPSPSGMGCSFPACHESTTVTISPTASSACVRCRTLPTIYAAS